MAASAATMNSIDMMHAASGDNRGSCIGVHHDLPCNVRATLSNQCPLGQQLPKRAASPVVVV